MIQSAAASPATLPPSQFRSNGMTGRLTVPVNPLNVPYTRFDHVIGVPARTGATISVVRVKILNSMLARQSGVQEPLQQELPTDMADMDRRIISMLTGVRAQAASPFSAGQATAILPYPGSFLDLAA